MFNDKLVGQIIYCTNLSVTNLEGELFISNNVPMLSTSNDTACISSNGYYIQNKQPSN